MSSGNKSHEGICGKCVRQSECEYKVTENALVLKRCLDFAEQENDKSE